MKPSSTNEDTLTASKIQACKRDALKPRMLVSLGKRQEQSLGFDAAASLQHPAHEVRTQPCKPLYDCIGFIDERRCRLVIT
ncbi:MAG: hypothetical protein ABS96_23620 [Lysobacteraceae bacterium SCN 69-123]|nr:MAG: hypothetical protein ABS96_23620 [Xanthomonadaceae bacterium SCN 69-123]